MPRYDPNTGQLETYQPGPFDSDHYYMQVGGKLPGGEEWSNGWRFAMVPGNAVVLDDTMLNAYGAAVQTFYTSTVISSGVKLSFMKMNPIDAATGKYDTQSPYTKLFADLPGTGTLQALPNQATIAVGWTTGYSLGLAHKGRFYIPIPSLAQTAGSGQITTAAADDVKAKATTMLTALNAVNPNLDVAIFSRKSGAPTHRLVTGVQVGLVWDTQRRRRRKLLESYR